MSLLSSDIWDSDLKAQVKKHIVMAVDRMSVIFLLLLHKSVLILILTRRFLLAQLHVDAVIFQPTKGHVKEALKDMAKGPEGLDSTYERAMERIKDQGKPIQDLASRILEWIVHARKPLSTAELRHVLAVRVGTEILDTDYLPSTHILRSVCAGLIAIDKESDIIRLVHYTAQQYFERTQTSWFPDAQTHITNVYVTYLLFKAFETGPCLSFAESQKRLQSHIFYKYAAEYWGHYAYSSSAQDLILSFLANEPKISVASQVMIGFRGLPGRNDYPLTGMTWLHVAAYFGLERAILSLLKKNSRDLDSVEIDSEYAYGRTPLLWAVEKRHKEVVELLLGTDKVEVNSRDTSEDTPLMCAVRNEDEAVVKLLLETGGIEVDSRNKKSKRTPLSWAAGSGCEEIVKMLLENGADLHLKDEDGQNPLSWAAKNGHETVAMQLLKENSDVESKDKYGPPDQTPLSHAAENGHEAVVRLLPENGANIESKTNTEKQDGVHCHGRQGAGIRQLSGCS